MCHKWEIELWVYQLWRMDFCECVNFRLSISEIGAAGYRSVDREGCSYELTLVVGCLYRASWQEQSSQEPMAADDPELHEAVRLSLMEEPLPEDLCTIVLIGHMRSSTMRSVHVPFPSFRVGPGGSTMPIVGVLWCGRILFSYVMDCINKYSRCFCLWFHRFLDSSNVNTWFFFWVSPSSKPICSKGGALANLTIHVRRNFKTHWSFQWPFVCSVFS